MIALKNRFALILLVLVIIVPLNARSIPAYLPQDVNSSSITITTRVLIVFAGIDDKVIEQLDLKESYTFNLTYNSMLEILLDIKILSGEAYRNITRFIDENSKYMNLTVFMKNYLEKYHPRWNISTGCYVRADIMEQYLYNMVEDIYNASNYDYILFLFYYPQNNCLRTYYIEKYFWEIHSTRNYTGLVAFGGNTPLFFIDFSSIPVTHPDKTQPLYGYGEPVDIHTFRPLWDLKSDIERTSILRKYVLDYLGFLVLRKLFNDRLYWSPQYVIDIRIVDYTNGSGYDGVLNVLNTSILYSYLHELVPYTTWKISINRTYANNSTLFLMLLENSTRRIEDNKTWIVLDYTNIVLLISGHYSVIDVENNKTIIPVYIFVANKPIHFEFNNQLNFTGAAVPGIAIIVSYPGYYYRILEEGMGMVIAHEVGHLLGLTHPFEGYDPLTGNETMIWLYDYIASLMSYAPTLAGWLGGKFTYDSKSLCRYHALDLLSMLSSKGKYRAIVDEALNKLMKDKCLGETGALKLLIQAYLGENNVSTNTTSIMPTTETTTVTLTETTTETITITKTTTTTYRETTTQTVFKEETITTTNTITIEKTSAWPIYLLGVFIILTTIIIILVTIIIARRSK